jgi:hypothetical protein
LYSALNNSRRTSNNAGWFRDRPGEVRATQARTRTEARFNVEFRDDERAADSLQLAART